MTATCPSSTSPLIQLPVSRINREQLNGHTAKVVWFTGLSGAGKSTLAIALEKELHAKSKRTYLLDGDVVRKGLCRDLGFSVGDRAENIRRVSEVSKLMMDAGLVVLTALISPYQKDRQMAASLIGQENFIEVFVNTPLSVCERRDPKGLYKLARAGQIADMTGIGSPYETPESPAYIADTTMKSVQQIVSDIIHLL